MDKKRTREYQQKQKNVFFHLSQYLFGKINVFLGFSLILGGENGLLI